MTIFSRADDLLTDLFAAYTQRPVLDYKLWVGLSIFVIHWAVSFCLHTIWWHGQDRLRVAYAFGVNLLMLHVMQYYPTYRVFLCILIVLLGSVLPLKLEFLDLLGEQAFDPKKQPFLSRKRVRDICHQHMQRHHIGVPELAVSEVKDFTFDADNVYLDLGRRRLRVNIMFLSQVVLMGFYTFALFDDLNMEKANYSYWTASFVSVQIGTLLTSSSESQLGAHWMGGVWAKLMVVMLSGVRGHYGFKSDETTYRVDVRPFSLCLRCFMSFFVNGLCRDFITFTVPILLFQEEDPMDFVKDCLAVVFITTLDDLSDPRTYSFTVE